MPDRATIGSLAPLTALAVAAEATTRLRIGSVALQKVSGSSKLPVVGREAVGADAEEAAVAVVSAVEEAVGADDNA